MKSWEVTVRTGDNAWSIVTIEASDHLEAGRVAVRLLGGVVVVVV